jgi:hypothetical protein
MDIIPVIGGGKPLFSFLEVQDLHRLKVSCKILNEDVETYMGRWGASPPTEYGPFVRKDDTLYFKHEGQLYDDFRIEYYPCNAMPKKDYDEAMSCYKRGIKAWGMGTQFENIIIKEMNVLVEGDCWGWFLVYPTFPTISFLPLVFRTKAEYQKWVQIYEVMKPSL